MTRADVAPQCGAVPNEHPLSSAASRSKPKRSGGGDEESVQALDAVGPALPVLVDLDEQLEVGPGRELLPRPDPDLLEHRAALADDHALLAVALDQDLDADAGATPTR